VPTEDLNRVWFTDITFTPPRFDPITCGSGDGGGDGGDGGGDSGGVTSST
jgi:hypothetical protein